VRIQALKGKHFTSLTVIERAGSDSRGQSLWLCQCVCGKKFNVIGYALTSGNTKSCGCLKTKKIIQFNKEHAKHGMKNTPTYRSWRAMHQRCRLSTNASWKYYGGLGVKVCKRWNDFRNFLKDMGIRPSGRTLDRKRPSGNYKPSNCRWATPLEQRHNRRVSHGAI
jgi:hypothetical protein